MKPKHEELRSDLLMQESVSLGALKKAIDQHAIISITDANGVIVYANEKFCEISGYALDELLGETHRIIKSTAHSPDFFKQLWETISQGETWQGMIQNRSKDGSPYWVQTTIMPVDDKGKIQQYISIRTDVTRQIVSQRNLRRFKQTLDQTLDCIFIFNAQSLHFTYVNKGAVEQVGYSEAELLEMTPIDVKPEINEQQFYEMIQPLLKEEEDSLTFETVHEHKSGRRVPVEIVLQYFPEVSGPGQFVAIVRDVSERKRTTDALEALAVADPGANVFNSIAKSISEALGVPWVGVGKINRSENQLEMVGAWTAGCEGELNVYALDNTPFADMLSRGESLIVPDLLTECYPDIELLKDSNALSFRGELLENNAGEPIGIFFAIDNKVYKQETTKSALMRMAARRAALELEHLLVEQAAQTQSKMLYETLERMSDGFFSLDEQWRFTYLNPSAAEIFGVSWREMKGKNIWAVLPGVAEYLQPHMYEAINGQRRVFIEEVESSERSLAMYVYPSLRGVSVYMHDVTEYNQLQEKHREMERQLQKSQKMEAIGQLTAGIAHDFNNILASINGFTDLALTRCVNDEDNKLAGYLGQIYKAGERARALIQQMMAYNRAVTTDGVALDPRPLIKETVKLLRSTLPASIQLSFDFPVNEKILIKVEPVQLQQLLMNLCVNARDAMEGVGHLELNLQISSYHQAECHSCHNPINGEYVVLSVADTGSGMSQKVLDHLFEPFFTTKDVGEGTGLGLSVVHGIVHEHHGHVRVKSEVGKGTVFYLLFPLLVEEKSEGDEQNIFFAQNATQIAELMAEIKGKRVLVVDDEPSVLKYLDIWLQRQGLVTKCFEDSLEALAHFEAHPDEFDLLITDHTMPGITGKELIDKIEALRPELPAILCSGYVGRTNVEQAVKLGVQNFVEKPFNQNQLFKVVTDLLQG